jgi:hypothetical protein
MNAQHLSSSEREQIEQELREAIGTLIAGCEALDMELACGVFSDSPDFLMMGTDHPDRPRTRNEPTIPVG